MTQRFFSKYGWFIALAFCICSTADAQPLTAEGLHQRSLAAACAGCHGTEGRSSENSAIPTLAGMPKEVMVTQLKAFHEGTRPASVMHQISNGLTQAQVESIATYYANIKR